jgi:ATP-dependent RNA helicase DDX18/HAS1
MFSNFARRFSGQVQQVASTSNGRAIPNTFSSLKIHPTIQASILNEFKFETMTACQAHTIAPLLLNKDVHLLSKTGSGKTLAFLIPSISKLVSSRTRLGSQVSILVVSPTRELAMQVFFIKL